MKLGDCINFKGTLTTNGYGVVRMSNKRFLAHRVAYELVNKKIPKGMHVCHSCDNPPCVNPKHLFLGTSEDNRMDMVRKGRAWWQKYNPKVDYKISKKRPTWRKLTDSQVLAIRKLYKKKSHSMREIARMFKVSLPSIQKIVYRKLWRFLP